MSLTGVPIAVGAKQHARLNLAEPVEHTVDAEVRRRRRPDRADTRRGEHRDHRLGNVRHESGDSIAHRDAEAAKRGGDARHLVVQLPIRQPPLRAVLIPEHQRFALVAIAKQVFGEVESRPDEPFWSEHGIRRCDAVAANEDGPAVVVGGDAAKLPDFAPELLEVANRPIVQGFEICDGRRLRAGGANLRDESRQVRARDLLSGRRPQWLLSRSRADPGGLMGEPTTL